jgi:opacity protein-like surface antigen
MKRVYQCAAFLLLAMSAPAAVWSQESSRALGLGVSGGLTMPMGDFGDAYDSGYNVTGHVFFRPSNSQRFSLRGDVSYDAWKGKTGGSVLEADLNSIGGSGNVLLSLASSASSVQPYVLGGLGMYRTKASTTIGSLTSSNTTTDFGYQLGGGLNFKLSGFSTFLELKYTTISGDPESSSFLPITFGIRF